MLFKKIARWAGRRLSEKSTYVGLATVAIAVGAPAEVIDGDCPSGSAFVIDLEEDRIVGLHVGHVVPAVVGIVGDAVYLALAIGIDVPDPHEIVRRD